jgi:hypothetical protein
MRHVLVFHHEQLLLKAFKESVDLNYINLLPPCITLHYFMSVVSVPYSK